MLEGSSSCTWKKLDDLTLKNYFEALKRSTNGIVHGQEKTQYQCLVEEKGQEEINARCRFLGYSMIKTSS